jgi:hypothetical protein
MIERDAAYAIGKPVLRGQARGLPRCRHHEHDAAVGVANLEIVVVGERSGGIGSIAEFVVFAVGLLNLDEHRFAGRPSRSVDYDR